MQNYISTLFTFFFSCDVNIYIYIYMMPKKSPVSYTILAHSQLYLHNNMKGTNKEHQCGANQIPSEGQVRMFSQL